MGLDEDHRFHLEQLQLELVHIRRLVALFGDASGWFYAPESHAALITALDQAERHLGHLQRPVEAPLPL